MDSSRNYEPAPFSDDPKAAAIRDATDYSIKISYEDAVAGRNKRPIRIFADGVYDMFHSGHARQLLQTRTAFPGPVYILVGIPNDRETNAVKGSLVMTEEERAEILRHCRYVDEVIRSTPFLYDAAFLEKHKIDFIAHDDLPYQAGDTQDFYKWIKDKGMFLATYRTEGVSTTDIITRILRLYPQPTPIENCLRSLQNRCIRCWQSFVKYSSDN